MELEKFLKWIESKGWFTQINQYTIKGVSTTEIMVTVYLEGGKVGTRYHAKSFKGLDDCFQNLWATMKDDLK